MKYAIVFGASIAPLVAGHGFLTSPQPRLPGSNMEAACGQQIYNNQEADNYGNIQGEEQLIQSDFTSACNLWLCKGYEYSDNTDSVQTYTAGQVVAMTFDIRAPHTGYANVSVVDTTTNTVIGDELISWDVFASNSVTIPANETSFSITIPDLGGKCTTAGDCVIQHFWNAESINQTYESCVDFVIGDSSSSGSSSASVVSSSAASTSAAATSVATTSSAVAAVTTSTTSTSAAAVASSSSSSSAAVAVATTSSVSAAAATTSAAATETGDDDSCEPDETSTSSATAAQATGTDSGDDTGDDDSCEPDETTTTTAAVSAQATGTDSGDDTGDDDSCEPDDVATTTATAVSAQSTGDDTGDDDSCDAETTTTSASAVVAAATTSTTTAAASAVPTTLVTRTSTAASAATSTSSSGSGTVELYGQCGGINWTGATTCATGTCTVMNDYYSQCVEA
ncbi:hypothetical protein BX600DRAFT_504838 [Xylariales sp. PMI_506]|nr:hypothetical protein BX600DRAFT_504838 [Xylariales sp. PMI_506]